MRYTRSIALGALVASLLACGGDETSPAADSTVTSAQEGSMVLTSPVFEDEGVIPAEYTCDGEEVSPPLHIEGLPEETRTMVLIVDDPDAPGGTYDHWVAYDVEPTSDIPRDVGPLGTAGRNSSGASGYQGPCPPSGTHRYVHQVYALDTDLGLGEGATKSEVLEAMEGHILAQATLTGLYTR